MTEHIRCSGKGWEDCKKHFVSIIRVATRMTTGDTLMNLNLEKEWRPNNNVTLYCLNYWFDFMSLKHESQNNIVCTVSCSKWNRSWEVILLQHWETILKSPSPKESKLDLLSLVTTRQSAQGLINIRFEQHIKWYGSVKMAKSIFVVQ